MLSKRFLATLALVAVTSCTPAFAVVPSQHDTDRQDAANRPSRSALWDRQERWVWLVSRCIREHESINAGHYDAIYPDPSVSTASGAYQMIDSLWRGNAKWVKGAEKYKRAVHAPAVIQDKVFIHIVKQGGLRHWYGTGCPGTE